MFFFEVFLLQQFTMVIEVLPKVGYSKIEVRRLANTDMKSLLNIYIKHYLIKDLYFYFFTVIKLRILWLP